MTSSGQLGWGGCVSDHGPDSPCRLLCTRGGYLGARFRVPLAGVGALCSKQSAGSVARITLVQTNMGSPGGLQASFNLLAIRTEVQTRVKEQPGKPAAAAQSALTSPVHRSCRGVQLFLQPKVANPPHTSHISGMPLRTLLTRRRDLHLSLGFAIEKSY